MKRKNQTIFKTEKINRQSLIYTPLILELKENNLIYYVQKINLIVYP